MEAQKPRSCLSDAFKAVRAREGSVSASAARAVPEPVRRIVPSAAASRPYSFSGFTKDVSNSLEASRELQQILSQAQQSNRSSIFGCSPPVRADNPVIHDSTFGRGSATEQCCGAFCSAYNQFIGFDSSPASALSTA